MRIGTSPEASVHSMDTVIRDDNIISRVTASPL